MESHMKPYPSTSSDSSALLQGKDDHYNGILVDPSCLPADETSFARSLRASLESWKSQGKQGIWLKLPIQNSNLVHLAVKEGFEYHHAEQEYVMLTYWIPEIPSTLPANASHIVAVGAFVINDQREVLVVQEMRDSGTWKIPTGVINQGEDIEDAVKRKVKTETGVDVDFSEVVGFRQAHNGAFGKSDILVICMLQPRSSQIIVQESDIETAKWLPMKEFEAQPSNKSNMLTRMAEIATASFEKQYNGFSAEKLSFGFRGKGSYFYYNKKDYENSKRHSRV